MSVNQSYHPADLMVLTIAKQLQDGERVFHGVASPLPMLAVHIARELHAPNLVYLSIAGGIDAKPEQFPRLTTADARLTTGTAAYFPLSEIFDLSARGELDVAFLSGVQFDGQGNLNMSVIGDFDQPKVRLPGGAGSAALLPTVKRAILWKTKHDRRGFVEKLDFHTASGNVDKIVTPLGVFVKEEGALKLWGLFPGRTLAEVQENTGFKVELSRDFHEIPEPTKEELELLDRLDPEKVRYVEWGN
jgi:glutaconate CoA-transferase subunit B